MLLWFLGDTNGSVESLVSVLESLDASKASLSIILANVGDVTEGDLKIAQSINGIILSLYYITIEEWFVGIVLGFGTATTKAIDVLAGEKYKVTLITNDVIYHLLDQLKVINDCLVSLSSSFVRIMLRNYCQLLRKKKY